MRTAALFGVILGGGVSLSLIGGCGAAAKKDQPPPMCGSAAILPSPARAEMVPADSAPVSSTPPHSPPGPP